MKTTLTLLAVLGVLAALTACVGSSDTELRQETPLAAAVEGQDASARATEEEEPMESQSRVDPETPGQYTVSAGDAEGLTYAVTYESETEGTGGIMSADFLLQQWDGVSYDRMSWQQTLAARDTWDMVAGDTEITVALPEGTAAVEVRCDPETEIDEEMASTADTSFLPEVTTETDENGQLTSCTFPVQFDENGKLFCTVQITLANGNSGEIVFALSLRG